MTGEQSGGSSAVRSGTALRAVRKWGHGSENGETRMAGCRKGGPFRYGEFGRHAFEAGWQWISRSPIRVHSWIFAAIRVEGFSRTRISTKGTQPERSGDGRRQIGTNRRGTFSRLRKAGWGDSILSWEVIRMHNFGREALSLPRIKPARP